jgi:hypothetical protein
MERNPAEAARTRLRQKATPVKQRGPARLVQVRNSGEEGFDKKENRISLPFPAGDPRFAFRFHFPLQPRRAALKEHFDF